MDDTVKGPNSDTADFVKRKLRSSFSDIGIVSNTMMDDNIKLGCPGNASKANRAIDKDTADLLLDNIFYLLFALMRDEDFREQFQDSIGTEIGLEGSSDWCVKDARAKMNRDKPSGKAPKYIIDLSVYNEAVADKISRIISNSFYNAEVYKEEFNDLVGELTRNNTLTIGFSASNFMYLIRALDKNYSFRCMVINEIEKVKNELKSIV